MRVTIDANIFIYAVDAREPEKQRLAHRLIMGLQKLDCLITLQCAGETYAALTRRLKRAPWEAAQAARNIMTAFDTCPASATAVERALAEAMAGRFSYWDALLLTAADEAGCKICFSEDMGDGARLGGIEVRNPFAGHRLSPIAEATVSQSN